MKGLIFKKGLNGAALKIIALISMTVDHVGAAIFPDAVFLRIIGRVAMPVFAFMIAEGCFYTKNKTRYFFTVFITGLICVLGYYVAENELYLNALITFSFSMAIIFGIAYSQRFKNRLAFLVPLVAVLFSAFVNYAMPEITGDARWKPDYGFFGTLLPVFIYVFKDFRLKLAGLTAGLTLVALSLGGVQWWAYLSLPFLIFYDGTRGKLRLKYFFYVYYPLHFVAI
ncbi:MAG: hypothetical protein J6Y43_04110 [Clostridia bacterium]|nr:hypothetical protein [Clostridia bacterium]